MCIWCSIASTDQTPLYQAIRVPIASSFHFQASPPCGAALESAGWTATGPPGCAPPPSPLPAAGRSADTARRPPPPSLFCLSRSLQEQYKRVGDQVNETKLQLMKSQMEQFRGSLEDFALKHRQDIRQDPVFRWARGAVGAGLAGRPPAPLGGC